MHDFNEVKNKLYIYDLLMLRFVIVEHDEHDFRYIYRVFLGYVLYV